ncbi:MAG: endonuclease/exonuclease/phosphatase family protein [Leeuwenhoekiella sp.]
MIFYLFCILFIIIAYLPLTRLTHWSIRIWDFVRIQTAFIQLIFLIVLISVYGLYSTTSWIIFAALVITIIFQLSKIIPFTSFYHQKPRKPDNFDNLKQIKLLTANVLQTNDNTAAFASLIREHKPDLFLTMESDKKWEKALDQFKEDYPFTVKVPLDNLYGMHLYSKFELSETQVNYLVEDGVPSIFTKVHYRKGKPINLICVHPAPPSPTENETSEERDAELLIVGKAVCELHNPVIVCGDLNDVVWSRVSNLFKKLTGLLDPRVGRGLYPSFHANYSILRFPIDQLFYSDDMYIETMERLPAFGSDHFAMYYSIWVENKVPEIGNPELDQETADEIEETIEEGLAK